MSRKRNKFLIALIILLVAAIIGTLAYIVVKNLNENNERKSLDNIAGSYASGIENGTTSATEVTSPSINVKKVENPIDFKSLQQQNSDIYSWIYIPNTNVNYPVLQGETNDTYIHSDIDHNELSAGSIFIASENEDPFNDFNTVIYGHNMKNGSMFAQLKKFTQDEETYKKSKYFWIFTPEKNYRYEIISAYTTGVNSDTYTLFKGPGEEFEKYLEKIRGYSEIRTDAEGMNIKDKIITLSTCTGNEATRYVVQGKRVDTLDVGQQNYEEQLPESEENRIAVKADDKNSDDKISVTVF